MSNEHNQEQAADITCSGIFLDTLLRQLRAQDNYIRQEGKSDEQILAPYILSAERRRELPLLANPDAATLWRMEMYYNAIGLCIEKASGIMATPIIKLHAEGFGRMVMITGRLVVLSKSLRDMHRFGFSSQEKLEQAGEKAVADSLSIMARFPQVADF
jgi:probable nitrogen fixation protein